jgi:hypothetical protein
MMSHQMPLFISLSHFDASKNLICGHTEDNSLGLLYSLSKSTHGDMSHPSVELLGGVEEIHQ